MLEMSLTHEIGGTKSTVQTNFGKLYADNKYDLMWKVRRQRNNSYVNMRLWLHQAFLNVRLNH